MMVFDKKRGNSFLSSLIPFSKKGQGLSLNVIIIAALALIVLVVLAAIFIQQSGKFGIKVGEETKTELIKMKIKYGQCHPTVSAESQFTTEHSQAESLDAKELAKDNFVDEISRCKGLTEKGSCESGGCKWS